MKEKVWLQKIRFEKLLCLAIMALVLLIPSKIAKAENYTLTLDDAWIKGNVSMNTTNFYEFEIPAAGWVNITYQGWNIKDSRVAIKSADLTKEYWKREITSTSDDNPGTTNAGGWMEAGRYMVCIKGYYGSSQGDYRLKGNFSPANNTEKEPNNGFQTAMPLVPGDAGKVLGLISLDDRVDFYSIYIPTTQKVQIIFNCMIWDGYFEIWDKDYMLKYSKGVLSCAEENPKTYTYEETLTAGTWYIKIAPYYNLSYNYSQGRYYLSWKQIVPASAISISGGRDMTEGEQITLYANVLPSNVTNGAVQWSSDNTSVATVDSNGNVTAKKAGTAQIKATAEDGSGVTATCKITVKAANVPAAAISISGGRDMKAGEQITLHANVLPSNVTNGAVNWSSDNTTVATVDSNGNVTAKNAGTAYIKATAADGSGVTATCKITVKALNMVTSIKISGNKRVAAGSKFNLKVSVSPSDASNKAVNWSSSKKTVATVSKSGKVTTKKPGKTVITAKAKDGSGKKASVTVIVVPKKVTISSVKSSAKGQIKLLWKKQSNISGYQIQVSKYKSFKNAKKGSVAKNARGVKINNLTSKKKYYVRVRSYIKIGSKKYYGSWSAVKNKKVK